MQTVFNYGFNNFSLVNIYKKDTQVSEYKINNELTIPLEVTKDIDYIVPTGSEKSVSPELKIEAKDLSKKSFEKGDNILKGTLFVNGKEYLTVDLAAGTSRHYESPIASVKALSQAPNLPIYAGAAGIGLLAGGFGLRKYIKGKSKK